MKFLSSVWTAIVTEFMAIRVKMSMNSSEIKKDVYRHLIMLIVACAFALYPMWQASQVILYFIGTMALIGIGVHLLRRIFFPGIDLLRLSKQASGTADGAASIFRSVVIFICTLFIVAALLIGVK
jgi:hypothetical protein